MHRRFRNLVLLLIVTSKLLGGLLVGALPLAVAAGEPPSHHCEEMSMADGTDESAHHTPAVKHSPSGHGSHESQCGLDCHCGCIAAPATLAVASIKLVSKGHPPEAHAADVLTVVPRPDLVFRPPI